MIGKSRELWYCPNPKCDYLPRLGPGKICPKCGAEAQHFTPKEATWLRTDKKNNLKNTDSLTKEVIKLRQKITTLEHRPRIYTRDRIPPSLAWYLLPLFLGFIGGLIGYLGVGENDKTMAGNLLKTGTVVTVFIIFIYWLFISNL